MSLYHFVFVLCYFVSLLVEKASVRTLEKKIVEFSNIDDVPSIY